MPGLALFGGAFDPFHVGHLAMLERLILCDYLDKIVLVPTFNPSHKQKTTLSFSHRFAMLSEHFQANDRVIVSDMESQRQRPSWTIDTLRDLEQIYLNYTFYLVLGADNFFSFHTWREFESLLKKVCLLIFNRKESSEEAVNAYAVNTLHVDDLSRIRYLNMPPCSVSSTEIRDKLVCGDSIKGLVPSWVLKYIEIHNLVKARL